METRVKVDAVVSVKWEGDCGCLFTLVLCAVFCWNPLLSCLKLFFCNYAYSYFLVIKLLIYFRRKVRER